MSTLKLTEEKNDRLMRLCRYTLLFLLIALDLFFVLMLGMQEDGALSLVGIPLHRTVFSIAASVLVSLALTLWIAAIRGRVTVPGEGKKWFAPVTAAILSFILISLTYIYLGVWPLGTKSVLLVDMHHQYAPLLNELRYVILHGRGMTYSFRIGLGTGFLPAFAYYLASPLNFLLIVFPEQYLCEAILTITLIKVTLCGGFFTLAMQGIFKRRDLTVILPGVLYALSMYTFAYAWNIMWLDVVLLMPLVVLALERLMDGRGGVPYALLLGLALLVNYYIGFMLCIFLVLYFVVWSLREKRDRVSLRRGFGRFAGYSLLAGGLAAMLLIPTALSLGTTSAAGSGIPALDANFDLFDIFGRLFFGSSPTIRSGNLPNIYCGVPAVFLLPLYFSQREIPVRRRIAYGGMIVVLLFSCTINQWDLLWHGLHVPNDLPYRFSFVVGFALLLIACRMLTEMEKIRPAQIFGSLVGCAVYLILWEKLGGDKGPSATVLYGNLLLLLLYGGALLLCRLRKMEPRTVRLMLAVLVLVEVLFSSTDAVMQVDKSEFYTARNDYLDNEASDANVAAISRAQELAAQNTNRFWRMEHLPRKTCTETSLYHYNGITTFASSNPYSTTKLMGQLGYAINGVNSYMYSSFVPSLDSLFGIRYLVLESDLPNHPQLIKVDTVTVGSSIRYIYENPLALPVGFFADRALTGFRGMDYAPFTCQENLLTDLLGEETRLYTMLPQSTDSMQSSIEGTQFYKNETEPEVNYSGTVDTQGQYFAYVDCRAAEQLTVTVTDADGNGLGTWGASVTEPYIIDLGELMPGTVVTTRVNGNGAMSGNVYIARLDADRMQAVFSQLAQNGYQVTRATDSSLTGTVTAPRDGLMFLSMTYDAGWTATVDGQPTDILPVDDTEGGALMAIDLPAGEHTVTLKYRPRGQVPGLLITIVCLLIVAFMLLPERIKAPVRDKVRVLLPRRAAPAVDAEDAAAKAAPTQDDPPIPTE